MGQSASSASASSCGNSTSVVDDALILNEWEFLHEQIRKHSLTLRQWTLLSYEDFHQKVNELNALSSKFVDCNGKQLLFEVKPGSDTSVVWKATARIRCIKLDPQTQKVEKSRELNLKQFLQVYNTLQQHINLQVTQNTENKSTDDNDHSCDDEKCGPSTSAKNLFSSTATPVSLNASVFIDKIAGHDDQDEEGMLSANECCICMERKPEVSLPCAHSYCLACIEQWNVNNKTCPICRAALENTDDTWVLEEFDPKEVSQEIQKSLFGLTK